MTPAVKRAIEVLRFYRDEWRRTLGESFQMCEPNADLATDHGHRAREALAGLEAEAALSDANAAIARQAAPEGLAEEVAKAMREGKA